MKGLLNGSTFKSTVKKDAFTTLGFKAGDKATINVEFTKGSTGGLTLTNAETVTATYGARPLSAVPSPLMQLVSL